MLRADWVRLLGLLPPAHPPPLPPGEKGVACDLERCVAEIQQALERLLLIAGGGRANHSVCVDALSPSSLFGGR